MEKQVLTQEEIQQLKEIKAKNSNLVEQFGLIEYQIQLINIQKNNIIKELNDIKNIENKLGNELQNKYGNGTIDIENGVFIPN
jgi:hypothetical protein